MATVTAPLGFQWRTCRRSRLGGGVDAEITSAAVAFDQGVVAEPVSTCWLSRAARATSRIQREDTPSVADKSPDVKRS
jgi:hypothetical protein